MPDHSAPDATVAPSRTRFLILAGSAGLGLLVFGASSWSARRSAARIEQLGDFHAPAVALVEDMRARMAEAIEEAFAYLVLDLPEERDEFMAWSARFDDQLDEFIAIEELPEDSAAASVVQDLRHGRDLLVAGARRMFAEFEGDGQASSETVQEFEHTVDALLESIDALVAIERAQLSDSHAAARDSLRVAQQSALWVGSATLLLSLVLGLLLARRTANELRATLVHQTRLATIGQISASIAHELRNPLGAIRNAAYFVRRHRPPQEKVDEYNDLIQKEVDVATNIIRNLTEMARARTPLRRTVDLEKSLTECAERFVASPDVQVEISLDPLPFEVEADETQLEQVVGNLLTNAAQALEDRGRIEIRATRTEREDRIEVRDDGPGIDPDDQARLFEPLFSTKAKGTGLGLTISRQIVELHGGVLELGRTGPSGTTFRIRLPRIPTKQSETGEQEEGRTVA